MFPRASNPSVCSKRPLTIAAPNLFHLSILSRHGRLSLHTRKGYEKVVIVKQPTADPRSYIVNVGEREYRRNRRHLQAVPERTPAPPEAINQNVPAFPAAANQSASPFSTVESPPVTPAKSPVPRYSPVRTPVRPETPVKSPS